jgi:hypothetical protein
MLYVHAVQTVNERRENKAKVEGEEEKIVITLDELVERIK